MSEPTEEKNTSAENAPAEKTGTPETASSPAGESKPEGGIPQTGNGDASSLRDGGTMRGRSDSRSRPGGKPSFRRINPRFSKFRRRECRFCSRQITELSYKNADKLVRFTTERGKIMPRRLSGNCAKHQRMLARQIKIARVLALLPFVRE